MKYGKESYITNHKTLFTSNRYFYKDQLFTQRAPIEDWVRWRDYRFTEEVYLWQQFIHFWVSIILENNLHENSRN